MKGEEESSNQGDLPLPMPGDDCQRASVISKIDWLYLHDKPGLAEIVGFTSCNSG